MKSKELNEHMRQIGFVFLLLALAVLFIKELSFFSSSILGSFTLYILLRKPYFYLTEKKRWNKLVANLFLTTIVVLILLAFGGILFSTGFAQVKNFSPQVIMETITRFHELLLQKTGYNIFSKEVTSKIVQWMSSLLPSIFNMTNSIFSNAVMMIFILFFLLKGGKRMEKTLNNMVPLSQERTSLLKKDTSNIVISNAIGIPMIIITQALFATLGYWLFGVNNPIIWGVLTGLFGIVPILGTAIIWLPLSVFILLSHGTWTGLGLMAYCIIIITNIDNVIRIFLLDKYAQTHPLVTVFGIILGLNMFGFWGIIFGPLLIAGFLTLLKIYRLEFLEKET